MSVFGFSAYNLLVVKQSSHNSHNNNTANMQLFLEVFTQHTFLPLRRRHYSRNN